MAAKLSVSEMAEHLGVSKSSLYALAKQKRIPHIRIGDRIIFDPEKVEAALSVEAENSDRPSVVRPEGHRQLKGIK